ncbi:4Fe-4S dicluster domain-containing protein [Pseudodesulfovibrio cashew]|uniref:4Fe-4S dicluster domain-containing protein n=1 Tax=Pseudodesulfovibrio cashew TaxID=2678688 RepID=A0A6I6JFU4_9BACT|nr:(Fe-S)-binding protein [Pseudodesulfovibrio cashew]QGY39940.1 4Fe-4S dicluster domain-containing protein [Pseudodesulfovibrio cashew]
MSKDCILCGKCLEVCPLLRATGREELSPRAKADLVRLLDGDGGELREANVARLASLCLGCKRCRAVCSQDVDVPGLVAMLRAAHPDFKQWLWKTWLSHAGTLWSAGSTAAGLIPERFRPEKFGPMLKMLAGLKGGPGLTPFLSPQKFPDTSRGEKMLLFAGCTATHVQGRWLMAALRLLDGLGIEVLPGDFGCCGASLEAGGCLDEAKAMAKHNLAVWRAAGRPKVAVFCASCRAGLLGYSDCRDEEECLLWRKSILPLSEVVKNTEFMIFDNAPEKLGYHHPCHAGDGDPDFGFLSAVLGERLAAPSGRECCGFGGLLRLAAPEVAEDVNRRCWDALTGPEVIVTGCSACVAQLAATAPEGTAVGHWLELIG